MLLDFIRILPFVSLFAIAPQAGGRTDLVLHRIRGFQNNSRLDEIWVRAGFEERAFQRFLNRREEVEINPLKPYPPFEQRVLGIEYRGRAHHVGFGGYDNQLAAATHFLQHARFSSDGGELEMALHRPYDSKWDSHDEHVLFRFLTAAYREYMGPAYLKRLKLDAAWSLRTERRDLHSTRVGRISHYFFTEPGADLLDLSRLKGMVALFDGTDEAMFHVPRDSPIHHMRGEWRSGMTEKAEAEYVQSLYRHTHGEPRLPIEDYGVTLPEDVKFEVGHIAKDRSLRDVFAASREMAREMIEKYCHYDFTKNVLYIPKSFGVYTVTKKEDRAAGIGGLGKQRRSSAIGFHEATHLGPHPEVDFSVQSGREFIERFLLPHLYVKVTVVEVENTADVLEGRVWRMRPAPPAR